MPKLIYTIPNFHNPAGVTMSEERRRRLVEIAADRDLVVLEDNPYGRLRFEGRPLPTLAELDAGAGHVVYLGTFSKILAPGLRLGYAVAPAGDRRQAEPRQAGDRPVQLAALADAGRPVRRRAAVRAPSWRR